MSQNIIRAGRILECADELLGLLALVARDAHGKQVTG